VRASWPLLYATHDYCVKVLQMRNTFLKKNPFSYALTCLTLSLLISYIYIYICVCVCVCVCVKLLVKPEILRSYIYGPTFGNAESRLFLFAAQCFNTEAMQKVSCVTVVCKHFASYQGYSNYRGDLIQYAKG
jgi:hypothetical protein